jgi:predicted phage terminase large subunit-like protein
MTQNKKEKKVIGPKSEKQRMILQDNSTDVLLCGGGAGGSKSYTCLLKALKYVQDPAARVLIVRESYPVLKLPGGLVDESQRIYREFGAEFKIQALTWVFKNGAEIKFSAIPQNIEEWQGLQASHILVDEAASQTEHVILFLLSRLRSGSYKGHMNLTMTCNPDRNSFLYNWLCDYCLDPETGIPVEGTEDIVRYFVSIDGVLKWGNSKQELYDKYGQGTTLGKDFLPKSFKFIPLTVYDNPTLLKNNPDYLANLMAQPRVNQQRYLHGSWTARPSTSSYFSRSWVEFIDAAPTEDIVGRVRSYDIAATEKSEQNKDPDYTAGVKVSRDKQGVYYIEHARRYRKKPDGVLKEIIATAKEDGLDVPVTIPRDPGAGGVIANRFFVSTLTEAGVTVKSIQTSGHTSKVNGFLPFSALAEAGMVKVVRDTPNDRYLDDMLMEMEYFTGGRNEHNDFCDAISAAFSTLMKQNTIPTFSIPTFTTSSPIPSL